VFGFTVTNTVPDILLERVTVAMSVSEAGTYSPVCTIGIPRIREGNPGHVYVAFLRSPDAGFGAVSFSAELRFSSRECDPANNYEPVGEATKETYPVNDVDVGPADYVAPLNIGDFKTRWDEIGADAEVGPETLSLSFRSVPDAVAAVFETLGLSPLDGTGFVKSTAAKHAANLAGTFLGDTPVYARLLVSADEGAATCTLKIALRSPNRDVAELLMNTLA
jgi:hypothetical protein